MAKAPKDMTPAERDAAIARKMAELRSKGYVAPKAAAPAKKPGFGDNMATMARVIGKNSGEMVKQRKVIIEKPAKKPSR